MDETLTRLQRVFQETFHVDPKTVTMDTTVNDIPAWDSLGHVQLAGKLETAFGLHFELDEFMEMSNVRAIWQIIQSKLNAKS